MKTNKLFGGIKMSWAKVILLSVVVGVAVGLLMLPQGLSNTSFQQPGISFEFWILFALFIILNCQSAKEAGLKVFVAFLISQPVIYLVQVPFSWQHWDIFMYYKYWFIITLLTLPGGMIAWYVKRGDLLSVIILSVANLILCIELPTFFNSLINHFPHMLVAILFILAEMVFFIKLLFDKKPMRRLAFILAGIMLLGAVGYTLIRI